MGSGEHERRELTQMFLQHRTSLYGFILAQVRHAAAAEDVFQDVWLAICEQWERYDRARPFGPWARGIARHKTLQYFAAHRQEPVLLDSELAEELAVDPAWDVADDTAEKQALLDCLRTLSGRAREILSLRFFDGLKAGGIAERIGWTARAVSVALVRAKRSLYQCVDTKLADATR